MSTGFALSALRVAIVAIPAVLIVLFAGLVAVLALVMDRERREYSLDFARVCTDLAAVLVNGQHTKMVPGSSHPSQ
jgi:hypothetical protein